MKKFFAKLAAGALAALLPFLILAAIGLSIEPQFKNTFLGALADKFHRLEIIGKPKIVIVGGSSTAFGLNSDLLSEELGMPVVNFGLYATLGTKLMLDLSRPVLKSGDIVVLAPELDRQTLSLYFNAESAWQAFDSDMSMLRHTRFENYGALAGNFWDYALSKLKYGRLGGLDPDGVYSRSSFDVNGDIIYSRPHNIMPLGYSPNHPIDLDPSILDGDFAGYVNEFVRFAKGKGATVYFDFPPMNRLGVVQYGDSAAIYEFYLHLAKNLDCEIIGDITAYILDEGYFYDSNYHLNDSGVLVRTALLAEDIRRALGIAVPVSIKRPPPPGMPEGETLSNGANDASDAYSEYFLYGPYAGGLVVTGVSEAGKSLGELTIPRVAGGKAVLAIGERAFAGCGALAKLTIGDNIAQIYDYAFEGCGRLEMLVLEISDPSRVAVGDNLLGGADSCRIYLSREAFGNFAADYFWGRYSKYMSIIN